MKKNAVILFKFKSRWNDLLISKLTHEFNISILFLSQLIDVNGFKKTVVIVNDYIVQKNIDVIFFDVEFFPEIDANFISDISTDVIKICMYFDDLLMHDFNAITASCSDLVLVADPISVLKYKEKGINAEFFPLECSGSIFYNRKIDKDIDVLFDGTMKKGDRSEYIEYLRSNGINVTVLEEGNRFVSYDELGKLISRSKIALDLSKSDDMSCSLLHNNCRPYSDYFKYYFQLKGRPIQVGLCKTVCISEYTPALRLLFSEEEVPSFTTYIECFDLINQLINDQNRLAYHAEKLHIKVISEYEDKTYMKKLSFKIKKRNLEYQYSLTPDWYKINVAQARIQHLSSFPKRHFFELLNIFLSGPKKVFFKVVMLKYMGYIFRKYSYGK
ncbi:MAG: hypothetical protein HQ517_16785 [SAR324 cluster bacterium]|nr:hypothetical protein [SAR324 cluster bacterium]